MPQGSILGPLLFLAFINDISSKVQSKLCLFADNCVLYSRVSSDMDSTELVSDLRCIETRCTNKRISLNVSRCVNLSITKKLKE